MNGVNEIAGGKQEMSQSEIDEATEQWFDEVSEDNKESVALVLLRAIDTLLFLKEEQKARNLSNLEKGTETSIAAVKTALCMLGFGWRAARRLQVEPSGVDAQVEAAVSDLAHPKMIRIPAGKFTMGASTDEQDASAEDEYPRHDVFISAFELADTPVTVRQWRELLPLPTGNGATAYTSSRSVRWTRAGDDCPVTNVSWDDAVQYCRRLSEVTGQHYRLPTEAEWEYACRAGTTTTRYGALNEIAVYAREKISPVRTMKPNSFGLYDMIGNVWEWVQDWYGPYSAEVQQDPAGPSGGSYRVLRGGGWLIVQAWYLRASYRLTLEPGNRYGLLGFRCARSL